MLKRPNIRRSTSIAFGMQIQSVTATTKPYLRTNIWLYCVPLPQRPTETKTNSRPEFVSTMKLVRHGEPYLSGLLQRPPALPAPQDCIFYLSLRGFTFAISRRTLPARASLSFPIARARNEVHTKGKSAPLPNQKQRAPRSLLENRARALDLPRQPAHLRDSGKRLMCALLGAKPHFGWRVRAQSPAEAPLLRRSADIGEEGGRSSRKWCLLIALQF